MKRHFHGFRHNGPSFAAYPASAGVRLRFLAQTPKLILRWPTAGCLILYKRPGRRKSSVSDGVTSSSSLFLPPTPVRGLASARTTSSEGRLASAGWADSGGGGSSREQSLAALFVASDGSGEQNSGGAGSGASVVVAGRRQNKVRTVGDLPQGRRCRLKTKSGRVRASHSALRGHRKHTRR